MLFVLGVVSEVSAQSAYEGMRVAEIAVEGLQKVPEARVRALIKTKVGGAFQESIIQQDAQRIAKLEWFYYPTVRIEEVAPGAVKVTFELIERQVITKIVITGNKYIWTDDVRRHIEIKEKQYLDLFTLRESVRVLDEYYKSKGLAFSEIAVVHEETDEGVVVTLTIVEGPVVLVQTVLFEGNTAFDDRDLSKLMVAKPHFFIIVPGVYDTRTLDEDRIRLESFYRSKGYLDARVSMDTTFNDDKTRATVTVYVEEGPSWRLGEIRFVGNELFTDSVLRDAIRMKVGDVADSQAIDQDVRNVLDKYGDEGYVKARVVPKRIFPLEGTTLVLEHQVTEGARYTVDTIGTRGNVKTKDEVIRRELTFFPGEPANRFEIEDSVKRLQRTGYFESVAVNPAPGRTPNSLKYIIDVTEARTAHLVFSTGLSSNQGIIGGISFEQRNFDLFDVPTSFDDFFSGTSFVGAGQVFSMEFQPGTEFTRYRINFQEPYFLGEPISFSSTVFAFARGRESYDEKRLGGSVSFGIRPQRRMTLESTLRGESIEITNVSYIAPADVFAVEGENWITSLKFSVAFDTTERESFARHLLQYSGYSVGASYEYAPEFLGSDFEFHKVILTGKGYWSPWEVKYGKHILGTLIRIGGMTEGGGSDDVPIFERFFAGGNNSIRGFDFRGVGPHVMGTPIGGEVLLVANTEYSFPIFDENIRGALFLDTGAVYPGVDAVDLSELRISAGLGLRIFIPGMGPYPVGLDWAWPLSKQDEDETEIFGFNVGTSF